MNNKGQALIEFIIILPILLLILFSVVDFGNIYSTKLNIENTSNDIIELINKETDINSIRNLYKNIDIKVINYNEELDKVILSKDVNILTPGLNRILKSPYKIEVERIIPNNKAW